LQVLFNEENIWKQIHAIRKIIGYEGTIGASCTDELKALYIFTGVEPPTFVKENPFDTKSWSTTLQSTGNRVSITL
jgi:hypothetical protein